MQGIQARVSSDMKTLNNFHDFTYKIRHILNGKINYNTTKHLLIARIKQNIHGAATFHSNHTSGILTSVQCCQIK